MKLEEYEPRVKERLSEGRFYHSQCVAECAARLAEKYGADVEKARLAGILHDVMKDTEPGEQLKIIEQSGIILTEAQRRNTKLWHAISGAAYAEHVLGVSDREVLDAIACHTGGKAGMTVLDKVLFVADYISDDRDYDGVEEMRMDAESSLEEAMVEGITFTMQERMGERMTMEPRSIDAYNEAVWVLEERERIKQMEGYEIAKNAARLLDEKKAEDIVVIKIDDITSLADYFVIASGRSSTHMHSLSDELEEKLKMRKVEPLRVEGYRSDNWVLMDYNNVVVHIFTQEGRDFYSIDRLWSDGEKMKWQDICNED